MTDHALNHAQTGRGQLAAQKRGRRIAMSDAERDELLAAQRVCRVATVGPDGPHATPLWFAWHDGRLWLYSITRSRRWADLARDRRVGVVVDAGEDYGELRGVEIAGTADVVGEVPRTGIDDAALTGVEAVFAAKFLGAVRMLHDGRHGWLRVTPTKIVSWDFRKLAAL